MWAVAASPTPSCSETEVILGWSWCCEVLTAQWALPMTLVQPGTWQSEPDSASAQAHTCSMDGRARELSEQNPALARSWRNLWVLVLNPDRVEEGRGQPRPGINRSLPLLLAELCPGCPALEQQQGCGSGLRSIPGQSTTELQGGVWLAQPRCSMPGCTRCSPGLPFDAAGQSARLRRGAHARQGPWRAAD